MSIDYVLTNFLELVITESLTGPRPLFKFQLNEKTFSQTGSI